jgi:hypothetical protein
MEGKVNIMDIPRLTKEQAVIISAYTGFLICNFSDMHEEVERRMGYPIWTHQFADKVLMAQVREKFKSDFIALVPVKGI